MAVLMLALAGTAWATGGCGIGCEPSGGAPTVMRTVPEDGAMGVDPNANIKVKFSAAMKARSINTSTFTLTVTGCGSLCEVLATVRYNAETGTAILDPSEPLLPNTEYEAKVEGTGDGDMKAVKDRGGTSMASDYIFSFTTEDVPPCSGC